MVHRSLNQGTHADGPIDVYASVAGGVVYFGLVDFGGHEALIALSSTAAPFLSDAAVGDTVHYSTGKIMFGQNNSSASKIRFTTFLETDLPIKFVDGTTQNSVGLIAKQSQKLTTSVLASPPSSPATDDLWLTTDETGGLSAGYGVIPTLSTSRPGSPFVGQLIYETDTGLYRSWTGGTWLPIPSTGPLGLLGGISISTATTSLSSTNSTEITVGSFSFNVLDSTRTMVIRGQIQVNFATAANLIAFRFRDATATGTLVGTAQIEGQTAGGPGQETLAFDILIPAGTLSNGSHTLFWRATRTSGTGTDSLVTTAGNLGNCRVEDIGIGL